MRPSVPFAFALLAALVGCDDDPVTTGSGSSGSSTSTGSMGSTTLTLPQFVHGAAYVDGALNPSAPIVVAAMGTAPEAVEVSVDGVVSAATADGDRFVATVDAAALADGKHPLVVTAKIGGAPVATLEASLTSAKGSLPYTTFAKDGPAYGGHLVHDAAEDALYHSWISIVGGKHQLSMNRLDGAFERLDASDTILNAPGDEPLNGYTAFGPGGIGVVYRTAKAGDPHWSVKLRVVDKTGAEKVPAQDLTGDGASFSMQQAGADANGFSAAWLHITPTTDPNAPPPVEVRFARFDTTKGTLSGPITLDADGPDAGDGPQRLEPLGELGVACNATICLVSYSRQKFDSLVAPNVPKLYLATVDLATGGMVGSPVAVADKSWDTQLFGHHLVALADGSFRLIYTANDTKAAVTPKSPCDETLERDLLNAVDLDATGKIVGRRVVFDFEGSRQYPRIAPHPAGFAMLWEDQRSECGPNGHIRMAVNVGPPGLDALLDPYVELPGSVGLPPEDPTLATVGTNVLLGWSDNRHGNGLLDPKNEIFLDTYWRP
ncbi:MAG: hypothetical protein U0414_06895 [Polyangiaceae bacterium]